MKHWKKLLFKHIISFASCSKGAAKSVLTNKVSTIFLDGYDEIFMENHSFSSGYEGLEAKYSKISITVSSRTSHPNPLQDKPVIHMPELNSKQIEEILIVRRTRVRNA